MFFISLILYISNTHVQVDHWNLFQVEAIATIIDVEMIQSVHYLCPYHLSIQLTVNIDYQRLLLGRMSVLATLLTVLCLPTSPLGLACSLSCCWCSSLSSTGFLKYPMSDYLSRISYSGLWTMYSCGYITFGKCEFKLITVRVSCLIKLTPMDCVLCK